MRLAASILCFFSSMLRLCRSIWFAWVVRQRHGTLTFPRVRTSDPSAGIAYSKTIFFPDRYRWWPFAMGPPIGTRGNEMRPPVTGLALTSCRGSDLDCRVGVSDVYIAKVYSPSWKMPRFLFRKALSRHR
jgi:hypothetical protein